MKIAFLLLGSGSGGLLSGSGLSLGGCGLNSGGLLNNWLLSWGGLSLNLSSGGLSHWDEAVGPLGRCRGGLVVSGSGVIDWCVVNWGSVVDWGVVDNGLVVHNGSGVVDGGRVVVDRGRVAVDGLVDGDVGRSMNSSAVLLSGVGVVHVLGSCMGLLGHNGGIGAVGFVNGVAHSWSISVLDDLMVGLVSGSSGQEGRDSDKSL